MPYSHPQVLKRHSHVNPHYGFFQQILGSERERVKTKRRSGGPDMTSQMGCLIGTTETMVEGNGIAATVAEQQYSEGVSES